MTGSPFVMKLLYRFTIFFVLLIGCVVASGGTAFAQKVSKSPPSVTLTEGQSTTIDLALNAPIICSGSPPVCDVQLPFTSSNPSQVTVSPNPVVWNSTDWSQLRTLTITALDDGTYSGDRTVTVSTAAVSSSLYYSGFAVSIPVTVHNINQAPTPATGNKSITITDPTAATTVDVLSGVGGSPDAASLSITSGPAHGSAAVTAAKISYTPLAAYNGSDNLTYRVCSSLDTSVCTTATLTFTISPAAVATLVDTGVSPVITTFTAVALASLACCVRLMPKRLRL
jgi:hypothetical protein